MPIAITKKRQKVSNRGTLLKQTTIFTAGLQPSHVLGVFLVEVMFSLLGLKEIA
jgi:hypothetical protein